MRLIYVVPLALAAGCVTEGDEIDTDDEVADTEQAVTSTALSNWTCSNTHFCNFDLGTASNRACFLAGIRGGAALQGNPGNGSLSGIWIDGNNHFQLTIYPPTGLGNVPITVTTTCVTPGAHYSNTHWSPDQGSSVVIGGTTSATRCFLSQVAMLGGGMTHYNDSVRVWKSGSTWRIGGSTQSGFVDGNAICFDATDVGDWGWGQGVSGSITGNLNSNVGGGVACGLTEIGGVFTTNSSSDGVWIDYQARGMQWIWTLVNFKHGAATCIK
ncbi:MAG: hypothetical protein ABI867_21295 [Kofleriaceae bacterium]